MWESKQEKMSGDEKMPDIILFLGIWDKGNKNIFLLKSKISKVKSYFTFKIN